MIAIGHFLFATAFSGYFSKKDWQEWADKRIMRSGKLDDWLINVSLSRDIDELSKALCDLLIDESHRIKSIPPFSDAVIGYFYLKYLDGKLSLQDLLLKSGDEADGGEGASVECEKFYAILNDVEKDIQLMEDSSFQKKISVLFEPFGKIAEQQKENLESY